MKQTSTTLGATPPGLIERTLVKLVHREAEVLAAEQIGPFVSVRLGGPALQRVSWQPGDKVQVQLGGWAWRTYTPLVWDAARGETELLVYRHGDARGANWAGGIGRGDRCAFVGPRRSLELARVERSAVIVGDETSLAMAASLGHGRRVVAGTYEVAYLFEVTDVRAAGLAIERLGLTHVTLIERRPDDAHMPELERALDDLRATRPAATMVLSGRAAAIQTLTRALRRREVPRARIVSKAYWAPGKKGLD